LPKSLSHCPVLQLPQMIFIYGIHHYHGRQRLGRFDFDDDVARVIRPPHGERGGICSGELIEFNLLMSNEVLTYIWPLVSEVPD
jgi:hypothetical protein